MDLVEARAWLRERIEEGARCPCCTQFAKVYKRRITASSAAALIRLYRAAGTEFAHWPTVNRGFRADECKMEYWGLVEEASIPREDGGRAGWWRVTDAGADWVTGRSSVPKYARIFDSKCLGLVGADVTIRDALGVKFNYNELMNGEG